MCVGTFTFGHVKPQALDEFVRITKKDGLICFTINEGIYVEYGFDKKIDTLKKEGKWNKGKSFDTFGPTGPYLVTKDEISDVQNLKMYLDVNGNRMQNGSTNTMIFSANHIVYYLSQFMSLNPGDIIATGTPPGVGGGMKPPVFLKAGDKMKLGIEGLGEQNQVCIQA